MTYGESSPRGYICSPASVAQGTLGNGSREDSKNQNARNSTGKESVLKMAVQTRLSNDIINRNQILWGCTPRQRATGN